MRETIEWNGLKWHRYPNAKKANHRKYFQRHGEWRSNPVYLHREVWKFNHGAIPDGFHVHHKNGDTLDNKPENLECVSRRKHSEQHRQQNSERMRNKNPARGLSYKAWLESAAGVIWRKIHARRQSARQRCAEKFKCAMCGNFYRDLENTYLFCGPRCERKFLAKEKREVLRKERQDKKERYIQEKYRTIECKCGTPIYLKP